MLRILQNSFLPLVHFIFTPESFLVFYPNTQRPSLLGPPGKNAGKKCWGCLGICSGESRRGQLAAWYTTSSRAVSPWHPWACQSEFCARLFWTEHCWVRAPLPTPNLVPFFQHSWEHHREAQPGGTYSRLVGAAGQCQPFPRIKGKVNAD